MRNRLFPGDDARPLFDGSIVIANYLARRELDPKLPGSNHDVYLTVFSRNECREISFVISDYQSGAQTVFVRRIRERLLEIVQAERPDAKITLSENTMRTLPP